MSSFNYFVVIERGPRNRSAYSPDVPGCVSTGATVEQTLVRMRRALRDHVAGLAEDGEPIPPARGLVWHLRRTRDFQPAPDDLITQIAIALPSVAPEFSAA